MNMNPFGTNENEKIVQTENTPEVQQAHIRLYEDDILKGILAAAAFREDAENTQPIEILRNGAVVLAFRIRAMGDEEYAACREKHTKYVRNKQFGIRFPEATDTGKFRSELILRATVEADRQKLWQNREAWKALNVLTAIDMVDAVLKAGEKDAVVDAIDKLSGYDSNLEEVAKN